MHKNICRGLLLSCVLALSGSMLQTEAAEFSSKIKVKEGVVSGAYDNAHGTVRWFGIPYAKQAVGDLRFAAPQKAERYEEKDCTAFAPVNLQFNGKKVLGEEGVLTLDIYRPDTQEKGLPVMFFIHGGNNQTSNSRLIMGDKFAKEANCVYVSVQYRLGTLGFNNLPSLKTGAKYADSGNYGFLDQEAALQWVHHNIRRFGGDPKNITVSGFSAGGRDVMAMLISPLFKNKFAKAVSFSGGLTVADAEKSQQVLARKLAPLAVEDSKAETLNAAQQWLLSEDKSVKNYLQNIKAERLAPVMTGAVIRMSAFPHLYGDGKLLPKEGFKTKNFYSVPLLLLASRDEFSSFAARDPFFKDRLAEINKDKGTTEDFAYANKYGSLMYGYFNGQESAERIYDNYKNDIYVCSFDYAHDPHVVGEDYAVRNGAFHGVFTPFMSDQEYPFTKGTDIFATPGAQQLSRAFVASLGAFMRSGDPNTKELGCTWYKWEPQSREELVFDAEREQKKIYTRSGSLSYERILAELAADNSIRPESKETIVHSVLNGRWFSDAVDKAYHNQDLWQE